MYSIIIANYNRISQLRRCLNSIDEAFKGKEKPEIIVVEDASDEALKDSRITKHILLEKNGGPVRARLIGASEASYEYVILLDSDDTLLEDSVDTIEEVRRNHPNFDLYGFTFAGGESSIDFEIKTINDYSDFVIYEGRTSDYMMIVKSNVLRTFTISHSYRISEIWLFSSIFLKHTCFYSGKSIFFYHQDATEQLSKKRDFRLKCSSYERQSVSKSVEYFSAFILKCQSQSLYKAWRKRLIKESILSFNYRALIEILCLKK